MRVSDEDGGVLVRQARAFAVACVGGGSGAAATDGEFTERFSFPSGVFVTINGEGGALRGCIGYPVPGKKLAEALRDAAVAAATGDPRFPPVGAQEIGRVTFEVTVLSEPEVIRVGAFQEYPERIRVGRDGLLISGADGRSGLLLPQVPVEQGWDETEFLERLCQKAGMERDCWKGKDVEISSFEGAVFKETSPGGETVRKVLS